MIQFCFCHIPKCGGTSVRWHLERAYGEDCFPNIAETARSQGRGWPDLSGDVPWVVVAAHNGPHELLDKCNIDVPVFTWVRDPITRRLSSVFHKARHSQEGSRPISDDFWDNKDEQAFIRKRFLENDDALYAKLWGGQEHRVAFVGRMEHFEEDWVRCVEFFGFPRTALDGMEHPENTNPLLGKHRYDELLDLLGLTHEKVIENPIFAKEYEVYENLLSKI